MLKQKKNIWKLVFNILKIKAFEIWFYLELEKRLFLIRIAGLLQALKAVSEEAVINHYLTVRDSPVPSKLLTRYTTWQPEVSFTSLSVNFHPITASV